MRVPACAWMTTSGTKPIPVTDWFPVDVFIGQLTTLAETPDPPMAMKWTTYAVALLVVQLRVKLVPSTDERSASACTVPEPFTIVSILLAIRRCARAVDWALSLDVATDPLVVPSVIPKPYKKPALSVVPVLPLVH